MWAFDFEPDGAATNKRVFATLRGILADHESGADGMAIDSDDRVYVTTAADVQVFDSKGQFLGMIKVDRLSPAARPHH